MSQAQPMDRIEFVEREFEGYREYVENLRRGRAEAWKQEHDELAARCWTLEDVVSKANYVYECNVRLAADLSRFPRSDMAQRTHVRCHYLMKEWLELSRFLAECAAKLEVEYGSVDGAAALRINIARIDNDLHSPRPITIDAAGNVYELSGERSIIPGLEPEKIRRGIEDADAGRVHSLKDVIAARART